jgi:hypothetical protein
MNLTRDPAELRELLGAYALDALEPEDREPIEQLLARDEDAREELRGYQHAVTLLHSDGPDLDVWHRIEATLDDDETATVVPIGLSRARWGRQAVRVAAVAAALVAIALWGRHEFSARSLPTQPASNVQRDAQDAARRPGTHHLTLVSGDGRSRVDVLLTPDGRGYILGGTLAPHRGRTLALFATTHGRLTVIRVIGSTLRLVAFHLPAHARSLAVGETTGHGHGFTALASAPLAAACPTCADAAPVVPSTRPPTAPASPALPGPAPSTSPASPNPGPRGSGGGGLPPLPLPPLPPLPTLP